MDAVTQDGFPKKVEELIARARALSDDERQAIAAARGERDEAFRVGAWRAALAAVADRSPLYIEAWSRIGSAYVPERLAELINQGSRADAAELAEWQSVARLLRLAIDEALLAFLTSDTITPPDLRELVAPWNAAAASGSTP